MSQTSALAKNKTGKFKISDRNEKHESILDLMRPNAVLASMLRYVFTLTSFLLRLFRIISCHLFKCRFYFY